MKAIKGTVLFWIGVLCVLVLMPENALCEEKIKIKNPAGEIIVVLKPKDGGMKIEFSAEGGNKILRGKTKDSGKKKYELEGGGLIAKVKPKDSGFKVKNPEGKLRWKVKISDEKIKISDNEENKNPYVLKIKSEKIKVSRGDTFLGEVKFYPDAGKIKVKDLSNIDLYKVKTSKLSAMYGVLLMDDIPNMEKYILMAELMERGK